MSRGSRLGAFKGCVVYVGVFALSAVIVGITAYVRFPQPEAW